MSCYDTFKLVACCGGSGDTLWEVASLFFSALPSRSIALEFMDYDKDRKARIPLLFEGRGFVPASIQCLLPGPHLPARNPKFPGGRSTKAACSIA